MQDMPDRAGATAAVQTIIAFDFGLRRIGVAAGQTRTATASPVGVISNSESGPDFQRISALLREWQPDRLVVGMPGTATGRPSTMHEPIRRFIDELARYDLPVDTVDERHTSAEAGQALKQARQAGSRGRIRKGHIDAAAAVLIAERYLAKNSTTGPAGQPNSPRS